MVFLFATVSHANGEFRLRARLDLSKLIDEDRRFLGRGQHSVFAIAFSPNDRVLAIAAGFHDTQEGPKTHIIVFGIPEGQKILERTIPVTQVHTLRWSSDGTRLLVQSNDGSWILNLDGGGDCHVGEWSGMGGFVGTTTFLAAHNTVSTTSLTFYDIHCNRVNEVIVPERTRDLDTEDQMIASAGEHGDIHILRGPMWTRNETLHDPGVGLIVRLLEHGKTVCAGRAPGPGDSTLRCWVLDGLTPRQISEWPAKRAGTEPTSGAATVPLVLFRDTTYSYSGLTERIKSDFKRWIIWDAQSASIVDVLRGKSQTMRFGGEALFKGLVPWAADLSSSGRELAIGGDNAIEIYNIGKSSE